MNSVIDDRADPSWHQGRMAAPGAMQIHPIYLVHFQKTAMSTLYNALRYAFDGQMRILQQHNVKFEHFNVTRFDDPKYLNLQKVDGRFFMVASHLPFGFHQVFQHPFQFVTLLRDPYRRVLSKYTYQSMRSGQQPNRDDFRKHFSSQEQRNVMTKQLVGKLPHQHAEDRDVEIAIGRLQHLIHLYGTIDDIDEIISYLLRINGLPNVIVDRVNRTEAPYQLDGEADETEVRAQNAQDQALFEFVKAQPKTVDAQIGSLEEAPPHPNTVLVRVVENARDGVKLNPKISMTEKLLPHIHDGRIDRDAFERFFQ